MAARYNSLGFSLSPASSGSHDSNSFQAFYQHSQLAYDPESNSDNDAEDPFPIIGSPVLKPNYTFPLSNSSSTSSLYTTTRRNNRFNICCCSISIAIILFSAIAFAAIILYFLFAPKASPYDCKYSPRSKLSTRYIIPIVKHISQIELVGPASFVISENYQATAINIELLRKSAEDSIDESTFLLEHSINGETLRIQVVSNPGSNCVSALVNVFLPNSPSSGLEGIHVVAEPLVSFPDGSASSTIHWHHYLEQVKLKNLTFLADEVTVTSLHSSYASLTSRSELVCQDCHIDKLDASASLFAKFTGLSSFTPGNRTVSQLNIEAGSIVMSDNRMLATMTLRASDEISLYYFNDAPFYGVMDFGIMSPSPDKFIEFDVIGEAEWFVEENTDLKFIAKVFRSDSQLPPGSLINATLSSNTGKVNVRLQYPE